MTVRRFIFLNGLCLLLGVFAACGSDGGVNDPGSASVGGDIPPQFLPQKQEDRQIEEHSFEVELDGWDKVMFAPFYHETGENDTEQAQGNRDVQFRLLRDGKTVYTFPARYEGDVLQGQKFEGVAAVSFYDYNGDGRKDILLLIKYAGGDSGMGAIYYEPRLYTQEEREQEFHIDLPPMEYLSDYRENIADMKKGLKRYARKYEMATTKSAWEVERFAKCVKRLILAGDFEGLAETMVFPIRIDGTVYIDKAAYMKAEFVKNPSPEFIEALQAESCEDLFCNSSGIMVGNGLCWILEEGSESPGLKVYAINGITPEKE